MIILDWNRKYILIPKTLYFFTTLSFYSLYQYRSNFVIEYFKFSRKDFGLMMGLIQFIIFFTNIGIATLNDKFNQPKVCIILMLILSLITFQFFFVDEYIKLFREMFWINMCLYLMFTTSVYPLLDKITLEYLNRTSNVNEMTYGRQRLFGTLGYLSANWILEYVIASKSKNDNKIIKQYNFGNIKYYQAVTTLIAIFLSILLIKKNNEKTRKRSLMANWRGLMTNKAFLFFIFIIFTNGITRAAFSMYSNIYYKEVVQLYGLKSPSDLPKSVQYFLSFFIDKPFATISMFSVFLEIFIMFYSQNVIKRFGLYWPLLFAQLFQLIRFVGYYMLNPFSSHAFPIICLIEILKGMNFGLTHVCAVQIATNLCPTYLKTTAQMIYSGIFNGLASVFAGILFGHVLDIKHKWDFVCKVKKFYTFFAINLFITCFCIILFVVRYGIYGNKLNMSVFTKKSK